MSAAVTLGDALPLEMARVRDHVMPGYLAIGKPGLFALTCMRQSLDQAARVMACGDVVGMLYALEDLRGFKE